MIPEINGRKDYVSSYFEIPSAVTYFGEKALFDVFGERLRKCGLFQNIQIEAGEEHTSTIEVKYERRALCPSKQTDGCKNDDSILADGYRLEIRENNIIISSSGRNGVSMALTTLYWILREGKGVCRCGVIQDEPKFYHRGVLIDSCRHFFPADDVKRMIEQFALRKINRIHWHLSDDQGYRLESRKFPALNREGSWYTNEDGTVYGGFYTNEQVADIVEYALVRGIEIIPEIDIPGHTSALIAAFPELSCSGMPLRITGKTGIFDRILCGGKDSVIHFLYELLDEICEIFPSKYFHIGGDEAPKKEWVQCKACQKRIREEGLKDEEELQAWLSSKIVDHLEEKGKTAICWNEAVKSKRLSENVLIQYWDEEEPGHTYCAENMKEKQKIIYSYSPYFYFDYIHAMVPIRMPWGCKPQYRSGQLIDERKIVGFEAALWAEAIPDREQMERMAFPRVFALAERAWRGFSDYKDFINRCSKELGYLETDGVEFTSLDEADLSGEMQENAIIRHWKPVIKSLREYGMQENERMLYQMLALKLQEIYKEKEDGIADILKKIFG